MNNKKTLYVKKSLLKHDLSVFPNFHRSGSIKGMRKMYYGENAKLIVSGSFIYKVTDEVFDYYRNLIPR